MTRRMIEVLGMGVIFAMLIGMMTPCVQADVINLASNNSTLRIDTSSQTGMDQWTVNGENYLSKQWFWYRIGSSGPEASFDTLSFDHVTNVDPTEAILYWNNGSGLDVNVDLKLVGGAPVSGESSMVEKITFTNNTANALSLHFFQYCDFDLSVDQDTVQFFSSKYVQQSGYGVNLVEELTNTNPAFHQAALVPVLPNLFNDAGATTLNNANGPMTGNASWAFQWDFTLQPGQSFPITKLKTLTVPEPASITMLGLVAVLGCCGFGWFRKRDR